MINIIVGFFWIAVTTTISMAFMTLPVQELGGMNIKITLFIFFLLFEGAGVFVLIKGLKQVVKNLKTKKYGLPCYAIVREIAGTGASVNGNPEYKAIIDFVNPETNMVEKIEEILGFNYDKYPINSYLQCKYYKGDINIEKLVLDNEVPWDIQKNLVPRKDVQNFSDIEFSSDKEYVTIDGVQYKKNN